MASDVVFKSYVKQVQDQIHRRAIAAAMEKAQEIEIASLRIVPIDDGELIDNEKFTFQVTSDGAVFVISYGNDPVSAQYAVIQHENPYYTHSAGKTYKFLERPFQEIAPTVYEALKKALS